MSYEQIAIVAMHCEWILSGVSAKLYLLTCFALVMDLTFGLGKTNQDSQFTILVPAGKTECFFQTTAENWSMEIEYQVIAGSGLDVGFTLISPNGYKMVSDFRRSDGIHTVDLTEVGDYQLCFDNSFSKLAEKMVFFEVLISSQDKSHVEVEEWADMAAATQDSWDSMVQYKLEDFRATVETIHWHLEKTQRVQTLLRAFEARDRYLLEDNLWRVSFWSCVNLLVILTVAVAQIYTLQRLFDSKKRVCT